MRLRRETAPERLDTAGKQAAACMEVADAGPGIPEAEQERIFDQFAQADTPRENGTEDGADETATDGLGLGLALTQELAELHGGTIDLESVPGEGSTFCVWLPLIPVDADGVAETDDADRIDDAFVEEPGGDGSLPDGAEAPTLTGDAPSVRTGGAEILVVEDNDDMRRVLCTQLSAHWTVREAASGAAAWDALQETPPDLILSDVMMPGPDGFELCERIKADPDLRAIPVVLLTARTAEEDTLVGLDCGADDYVAKPFDPAELVSRLDNHLAAREHLRERHRSEVRVAPVETVVGEDDLPFVEEVIEAVESRLSDPGLTVSRIADAVALSRRQLTRRLKDAVGQTPAAFLRERRVERAKELLADDPETIAEVAYAVGFRSPSAFSQTFRDETGRTPSEYVEQQEA